MNRSDLMFSKKIGAQLFSVLSVAFIASASTAALAADAANEPCKADAEKLCPGKTPRSGLYACMKQKSAELSPECKAKVEAGQAKMKAKATEDSPQKN